jgi:class 3 adenylate cyclase
VAELPTGTVTLLFTDVDASTELVKGLGERYGSVLAEYRDLLRRAFAAHGGIEVDTQGDSFFVAFASAHGAVAAAGDAQRALAEHPWPDGSAVSVRIGLHTGEPYRTEHGYAGVPVHRAARICTLAHGGQTLLSRATAGIVDDEELGAGRLRDLGEHRLKDFERAERIYQLELAGLRTSFPPLRTIDEQIPLTGTVTVVMAEGRRFIRMARDLPPDQVAPLLTDFQRLLERVFEEHDGREIGGAGDMVAAAFASPGQAVAAAVAAQQAVARRVWPEGMNVAISVGLHSGEAGVGWIGWASLRCALICDIAEGGQIFLSRSTAALLENDDIGEFSISDLGEQPTRRTGELVHVFELVVPGSA